MRIMFTALNPTIRCAAIGFVLLTNGSPSISLAHSVPDETDRPALENAGDLADRVGRMNRLETHRARSGVKQRAVF